jgi:ABC-type bacteriocin/lantibiotic exporter with double-glycine peptidase domain
VVAILPVPHRRQQSKAGCLPACVEMVLTYWQQARTQAALSRILGTDPDLGTPASRVLRLRTSTLNVFYDRVSLKDVHHWLAEQVPMIALVQTAELPYWSERCAHTVVVVGMDDTGVWVNDPAFDQAPLCVPADDFMLACNAMDNYAVVIRPAP